MSRDTLRAFLAVDLPAGPRAQLAAALEALRGAVEGVRWVEPENLHLTLKFLGDVERDRLERLIAGSASRIARFDPFEVGLGGFGAFPSARAARVLWLGVGEGAASLARLARKLDGAAARIGVPRERRPYRAHLTLGRLRQPGRVPLERVVAPSLDSFPVEEIVLYESRLSPTGATHLPLARLPLGEAEPFETEFAPEAYER